MKATTIEIAPEVAQAKLEAYRDALAGRHSKEVEEEYAAAMRGFEELAKGTALVDPFSAIREAGWRADGRPMLAMARADQRQVQWQILRDSRVWNQDERRYYGPYAPMSWEFRARKDSRSYQRASSLTIQVTNVTVEPPVFPKHGVAMVPMVPPDVLPPRGCDFSKHYILWEVESWDYAPPIDPMLLRPILGDLYAVIAEWNLTQLERTIIAGTRGRGA